MPAAWGGVAGSRQPVHLGGWAVGRLGGGRRRAHVPPGLSRSRAFAGEAPPGGSQPSPATGGARRRRPPPALFAPLARYNPPGSNMKF
ncbi:unnamed protein product [Pieris brassicae]|uniref:Uncharacterized protein n=1 Tax=Pieris brassicae TaxID=7116 RepID=A0A9P0TBJ7_PIEBR|nr:unnamed protein product [Pieris brassicae]